MLVLTRKLQETIQIGDNVTITILRLKGNTVRVGITAPRDLKVVRGELPPLAEGEIVAELTTDAPAETEQADQAAEGGSAGSRATSTNILRSRPLARFTAPALRKLAEVAAQSSASMTPALAK
jgi:carbon storage regulator CsrA